MLNTELLDDERIDIINADIKLIQKKKGLTFGTDTYLLCAFVKPQKNAVIADLGSGSGIASLLLLSYNKCAFAHAVEIQKEFCTLILKNACLNSLDKRIAVHNIDVRNMKPSTLGNEVDIVISNPPYMKSTSGKRNINDMKYIARHEVYGNINDFAAAASKILKYGGKFYCVYRPDRLAELVYAMKQNSLEPKKMTFVHAHENKEPSSVLIEAIKFGSAGMKVTKPLFLYSAPDSLEESDDTKKIYKNCSFED